jgi:hypothetical protein
MSLFVPPIFLGRQTLDFTRSPAGPHGYAHRAVGSGKRNEMRSDNEGRFLIRAVFDDFAKQFLRAHLLPGRNPFEFGLMKCGGIVRVLENRSGIECDDDFPSFVIQLLKEQGECVVNS